MAIEPPNYRDNLNRNKPRAFWVAIDPVSKVLAVFLLTYLGETVETTRVRIKVAFAKVSKVLFQVLTLTAEEYDRT